MIEHIEGRQYENKGLQRRINGFFRNFSRGVGLGRVGAGLWSPAYAHPSRPFLMSSRAPGGAGSRVKDAPSLARAELRGVSGRAAPEVISKRNRPKVPSTAISCMLPGRRRIGDEAHLRGLEAQLGQGHGGCDIGVPSDSAGRRPRARSFEMHRRRGERGRGPARPPAGDPAQPEGGLRSPPGVAHAFAIRPRRQARRASSARWRRWPDAAGRPLASAASWSARARASSASAPSDRVMTSSRCQPLVAPGAASPVCRRNRPDG